MEGLGTFVGLCDETTQEATKGGKGERKEREASKVKRETEERSATVEDREKLNDFFVGGNCYPTTIIGHQLFEHDLRFTFDDSRFTL